MVSYNWNYTGRFTMFSMITNIYNKKIKGPTTCIYICSYISSILPVKGICFV